MDDSWCSRRVSQKRNFNEVQRDPFSALALSGSAAGSCLCGLPPSAAGSAPWCHWWLGLMSSPSYNRVSQGLPLLAFSCHHTGVTRRGMGAVGILCA